MKTWVWVVAAVVGGYLVYSGWFGADEASNDNAEEPLILEVPGAKKLAPNGAGLPGPTAGKGEAGKGKKADDEPRRTFDLDTDDADGAVAAAPVRDTAAWELDKQRRAAIKNGDVTTAANLARRILAGHADSDPARWLQYEQGREHLRKYKRLGRNKDGMRHAVMAWRQLTPALFLRNVETAEKAALRTTLAKLAKDVLLNGRHVDGVDFMYTPKSGDSLILLCRKTFPGRGAKVDSGLIVTVNGMGNPRNLRAGEPIKVPLGESEIVIVKHEYRLYFLHNGGYVRDFRVGLGREGSTPEASFLIAEKIRKPAWNPKPGVTIPYGHPDNILGSRWMAFSNSAEYRGFGIHGTSNPSSIGKEESSGCIRMLRADVELLFDWVRRGVRVRIMR